MLLTYSLYRVYKLAVSGGKTRVKLYRNVLMRCIKQHGELKSLWFDNKLKVWKAIKISLVLGRSVSGSPRMLGGFDKVSGNV